MGQYYKVVNLDKGEYLEPHAFGDGAKLLEFGASGCGTMTALAVLLADGNGRGGGDAPTDNDPDAEWIGRWRGDRILIAGDYADGRNWIEGADEEELQAVADEFFSPGYQKADNVNLYAWADKHHTNISADMQRVLGDELSRG